MQAEKCIAEKDPNAKIADCNEISVTGIEFGKEQCIVRLECATDSNSNDQYRLSALEMQFAKNNNKFDLKVTVCPPNYSGTCEFDKKCSFPEIVEQAIDLVEDEFSGSFSYNDEYWDSDSGGYGRATDFSFSNKNSS